MSNNTDPAEALRQIKGYMARGASSMSKGGDEGMAERARLWSGMVRDFPLLVDVAERALEYDDWFGANGAQTDLFAISLRLHEALKRLGQRAGEK